MATESKIQKENLIEKIQKTEDKKIIEEIYRLLEIDFEDKPYLTNKSQRSAVREARCQINNGETLSEKEANKEAESWLNK